MCDQITFSKLWKKSFGALGVESPHGGAIIYYFILDLIFLLAILHFILIFIIDGGWWVVVGGGGRPWRPWETTEVSSPAQLLGLPPNLLI